MGGRARHPRQPVRLSLIARELAEATLATDEAGFEFEVVVITTCIRRRGRIEWVPIRTIYAGEASHIRPIQHLAHFLRIVLQARRAVRPRRT